MKLIETCINHVLLVHIGDIDIEKLYKLIQINQIKWKMWHMNWIAMSYATLVGKSKVSVIVGARSIIETFCFKQNGKIFKYWRMA